jgi:hypothetical protein
MNFQEPYRIHQINFDNLSFNKIKTVYNTNETVILKKIITIKYNDKNVQKPLVIQIPTLLNENLPMKAKDYHDLEIPLITEEKNKVVNLINFFENLDNKIISEAKKNSKLWFDKIPSKNCVKYKRIIKDSDRYKDGVLQGAASGGATFYSVVSAVIYFNGSTDYVEIYGFINGGTGVIRGTQASTWFTAFLARSA